jgi:predicted metal-dependent HD superfamily phosphohydrolase
MDDSQFQQATGYAIDLLQHGLLSVFTYHSLHHTQEVAKFCRRLAELEGIDEKNTRLLLTAAHFHDTGLTTISSINVDAYTAVRAVHEETAVQIARHILPGYGFTAEEINTVSRLIMATKWGREPTDLLEQIISDADMSSIGREPEYFMRSSQALRDELESFGIWIPDVEWYQNQKELLETHVYHTPSARGLFDANRSLNAAAMRTQLDGLSAPDTHGTQAE